MNKLAVGTQVRLSEEGKWSYLNSERDPYGEVGRIVYIDREDETGMGHQVRWKNGSSNWYYLIDLLPLTGLEENE